MLELLAEQNALVGSDPLMNVVQKLDLVSELIAHMLEQFRDGADVWPRFVHSLLRRTDRRIGKIRVAGRRVATPGGAVGGNGGLSAPLPVTSATTFSITLFVTLTSVQPIRPTAAV